jgi:hypothetical protein
MISILKSVFYANFWVALNVLALSKTTEMVFNFNTTSNYNFFVFFSTLLVYNFHRLYKDQFYFEKNISKRMMMFKTHKIPLVILCLVSLIICLYVFLIEFYWKDALILIPFVLISLWYVVPLPMSLKTLRELPFVKSFLVAFVWMYITVFFPLKHYDINLRFETIEYAIMIFLFITAITLPFDIRDRQVDHIKTVPIAIGDHQTMILSELLMLLYILIIIQANFYSWNLLFSAIIISIIIAFSNKKRGEFYYIGILDGLPLLQLLIIQL